jgi:hypothetical protein
MAYTPITIKYSTANSTPTLLNVAEPAYSYTSNTLFIGTEGNDGAIAVGGQYYIAQQQIIFNSVNAAFSTANSAVTGGGSLYANTAFVAANSAGVYANAAFAKANTNNLTVSLIDTVGNISNVVSNVTTLRFDSDSGFDVNSLSQGIVKVGMNSTFKYWQVNGVTYLTAEGIDTVNFLPTNGITITANGNTTPQSIQFDGSIIFNVANSSSAYANAAFAAANTKFSSSGGTITGPISGLGNSKLDFTTYGSNTAYLTTTNNDSTALFMAAGSAELYANTNVTIRANTKGTSQNWTFGEDGTLILPASGTISGLKDVNITGNLTVVGTTTYANTQTVLIADNILTLNAAIGQSAQPLVNAGIEVDRGAQPNAQFLWIETAGKWSANNGNNSIYIASESAESYANAAFLQANTPSYTSNSAASYANAAFATANTKFNSSGGTISGDVTVTGNIIPSASVTYNLGTPTNRWKDLYLSGTTINLGNARIESDETSGGILLIPTPTANVPNPTALFISSNGSLTTVQTTGGIVTAANLEQAGANTANSVPVDIKINLAFNQANSGFETANSSSVYANSAFAAANSITTNIKGGSF